MHQLFKISKEQFWNAIEFFLDLKGHQHSQSCRGGGTLKCSYTGVFIAQRLSFLSLAPDSLDLKPGYTAYGLHNFGQIN